MRRTERPNTVADGERCAAAGPPPTANRPRVTGAAPAAWLDVRITGSRANGFHDFQCYGE